MIFGVLMAFALSAAELRDETIARVFEARFSIEGVDYLLLAARDRRVVAAHWDGADRPGAIGSLVKPFVALAYAQGHGFRYPEHVCKGASDGCWLPRGHGKLAISGAVANSCNAYFLTLAAAVPSTDLDAVLERFALPPPAVRTAEAYIGAKGLWRIPALSIARAYLELAQRATEPGVQPLIAGMAESARRGTAAAIGPGALAKTGTARCEHAQRAPGDGYVVALFPDESPEYVLLVRRHSAPGAVTAKLAAQMIRAVREGR